MDIHVSNLPNDYNDVRVRLLLQDRLRKYDILAFDVLKLRNNFKKPSNWAIITVAELKNGRQFLRDYGIYGSEEVKLGAKKVHFKQGDKYRPTKSKIDALLLKEGYLRAKASQEIYVAKYGRAQRSSFPIRWLRMGVWTHNAEGKLAFDRKIIDKRTGSIIFGRSNLVLFRYMGERHEFASHVRIDVPYSIVEHVIFDGTMMTFTLRAPPKIYQILDTSNIELYSAEDVTELQNAPEHKLPDLSVLRLGSAQGGQRAYRLRRLDSLQRQYPQSTGLCMVYRIALENVPSFEQATTLMRTSTHIRTHYYDVVEQTNPSRTMEQEFHSLQEALKSSSLPFKICFQLIKLVMEGTLTPRRSEELLLWAKKAWPQYNSELVSQAIDRLGQQVPTPGPYTRHDDYDYAALERFLNDTVIDAQRAEVVNCSHTNQRQHLVQTYKATVTPTGMFLRGPEWTIVNRVLRKFHDRSDYFMRVAFADEDGQPISYDTRADQEEIYRRFRDVLLEGITLAGRRFEFLGWSHSSLREHQTWFMAQFRQGGRLLQAHDIRNELGNFSNIHCAAKCAARIGQAFSDTMHAIPISEETTVTEKHKDVLRNGRCFSDGCGTISFDLLRLIWQHLPPRLRRFRPTVLQIRYRGAKGVVSVDATLSGLQLRIRESMTKFTAQSVWNDLEICGANYRPGRLFLNHQSIKILEDAGITTDSFVQLQEDGLRRLKAAFDHPINAASLLESTQTAIHPRTPGLITLLNDIGLSYLEDKFLTSVVKIAAMVSLRDLKYRGRIEVIKGYLLYGIMDETNTLQEGQAYITVDKQDKDGISERPPIVKKHVLVTRAPALHPGDVQLVEAVDVSEGSPLRALRNCIVFSQQGVRDVPSMLSGGDLDGDEYGVILDDNLVPKPEGITSPADYPLVQPLNLGRSVRIEDMVQFLTDFMQQDRLGQICTAHKIRADFSDMGTKDSGCIALSELGSKAVDFSKSGVPADMREIASINLTSTARQGEMHRIASLRPDFMNTQNAVVMDELGALSVAELDGDDLDDPDHLSAIDPDRKPFRFYPSLKANGSLFRNIDERLFFRNLNDDIQRHKTNEVNIVERVAAYIDREAKGVQWDHHQEFAENTRQYYISNMRDIQHSLRLPSNDSLTELEVFTGNVLGMKARASNRYTRNAGQELRDRFNYDIDAIFRLITNGEEDSDGQRDVESLSRALACWKVAIEGEARDRESAICLEREGRSLRTLERPVESWKYVCAQVVLEQLGNFNTGWLKKFG